MVWKSPLADLEAPTTKHGVGHCTKHDMDMWRIERSVPSYKMTDKYKVGDQLEYQPIFCPQCELEKKNEKLAKAGCMVDNSTINLVEKETAIQKLARKKHIDILQDLVATYSFEDELGVVQAEEFVKFLKNKVGREKKVEILKTNKFIELRSSRFMSDEQKQKYLKVVHNVETADILVIDSLADYGDNDEETINTLLLSAKEGGAITLMTIPESADRLETMPTKLKFRFRRAQKLSISSKGVQY